MHRVNMRSRQLLSGTRGFTLFEVVMVILILGVLAYFVTTRLFESDMPTKMAELDLVKSHLRFAQIRAMNSESSWGIKFNEPSKYWLYNTTDGEGVAKRLPGDESSNGIVVLSGIQVSGAAKVEFNPFGSPGSGTITLSVQEKGGTGAVGQIVVTKNTGFIP